MRLTNLTAPRAMARPSHYALLYHSPLTTYLTPQYSRAMADLFKPMTDAFVELWLDGEKVRSSGHLR